MSEGYIVAIIIYDWYRAFEKIELACDQTYRLALAICSEYKQYINDTGLEDCYDTLNQFLVDEVSFKDTWEKISDLPDNTIY